MYLPALFHETRLPILHELIRAHPFATLVTLDATGLVANHIPMEIDAAAGPLGTLRGHVARANPVWKSHRFDVEAMAVFQGPHCYITPSHYPTKVATGKVVPTWNYATVHAHGPLRVIDDDAWLRRFIEQLTARHELARTQGTTDQPWQVGDAPAPFIDTQLKSIIGIELPISRVEGKWKVSQNRTAEDRDGVVAGLRRGDDPMQRAIAELVADRARPSEPDDI
jgi:transcriptional regulator